MIMTARRLRSIGWIATLVVCAALVMVLAFRVNALRSQVHQSNARIIALRQETLYLETEFEARANQQQLKIWNDVEFGYGAPVAAQYLDNERQLAAYAKPADPGAPAPVRVASADDAGLATAAFPAMVSPMTGKPLSDAPRSDQPARTSPQGGAPATDLSGLSDRLGTVQHADHPARTHKVADRKSAKTKDAAKDSKVAQHTSGTDSKAKTAKGHLAGAKPASTSVKLALREAKTDK